MVLWLAGLAGPTPNSLLFHPKIISALGSSSQIVEIKAQPQPSIYNHTYPQIQSRKKNYPPPKAPTGWIHILVSSKKQKTQNPVLYVTIPHLQFRESSVFDSHLQFNFLPPSHMVGLHCRGSCSCASSNWILWRPGAHRRRSRPHGSGSCSPESLQNHIAASLEGHGGQTSKELCS